MVNGGSGGAVPASEPAIRSAGPGAPGQPGEHVGERVLADQNSERATFAGDCAAGDRPAGGTQAERISWTIRPGRRHYCETAIEGVGMDGAFSKEKSAASKGAPAVGPTHPRQTDRFEPDPAASGATPTGARSSWHWGKLSGRLGLEFVVVLAGVFGALWADARVAAQAERRVEAARLEALDNSIEATLKDLVAYADHLRRDRALLRTSLIGDAAALPEDSLRLAVAVGLLGGTSQFEPQMDTYEDLRSSGELALLAPDVRRSLSAVDQRLRRLEKALIDLTTVQQLHYDPFAVANIDMVSLLGEFLDLEIAEDPRTEAENREILASRRFRNMLVFRLDLLENILDETSASEEALGAAAEAIRARQEGLR